MSVLDTVMGQLDSATIQRMSNQLGASPQQTQSAIAAALPVLIGAMQRNSSSESGAQALHGAVTRDHLNVDLGGLLGGILGGGGAAGGGGGMGDLLGGLFGGGQPQNPQAQRPASDSGGLGDLLGSVMGGMMGGDSTREQPQQAPTGGMGEAILRHVLGGGQQRAAGGISKASGLDLGAVMKLLPMLTPLIMAALGKMTQQRDLDAGGLSGVLGGEMQRIGGGNPADRGFLGGILDADGDGDVDASDLLSRGSQLFGAFGR